MEIATISEDAEGQTIHLSEAYQLTGSQVLVKRVGNVIVLLPHDAPYNTLVASIDDFIANFIAKREQPMQPERADPFA